MSLIFLSALIILTSPWFFLVTFEKIIPAVFYFPSIGEFLKNFCSYFSFDFLFFNGDPIFKNSIPEIGVFHLWELPFLLAGFYIIFSSGQKKGLITFSLVILASLASFFKPSPNVFWSVPLLFIFSTIIANGIKFFLEGFFKKKTLVKVILLFLGLVFIFYNSFFFWHQYKVHYPKRLEEIYE